MRDLSSRWTWFYKFAFPTVWIGGFAAATLLLFIAPDSLQGGDFRKARWFFLGATFLGALFLYWCCMRLKRVRLRAGVLLISNYRTEIEVPLHHVERVSGSLFTSPELVWLRFRRPTGFGSKVVFMAPWRFLQGFTWHPLVKELRELLKSASGNVAG